MSARRILAALVGAFAVFAVPPMAFAAGRVYLDPATQSLSSGSQASVNLMIDTSTQQVISADVRMTFPVTILQSVSVTAGSFFPTVTNRVNGQTGTIDVTAYGSGVSRTGIGTIATLVFRGIAPGTADLSVVCTPGTTTDTNIVTSIGQDVVDCSAVTGASITVGSSGITGLVTPTPTPTGLPDAGGIAPTIGIFALGIVAVTSGVFMVSWKATVSDV